MGNEKQRLEYGIASRARKSVVLIACCYFQLCIAGVFVALGIMFVEFVAFFKASHSQAALVQSLYMGICVGGGIFFTNIVVKYEAGIIVMLSSIVTTVSFCASAFAPNIQVVIVLIGVVSGLASSSYYLVAYVVVSWTFQENRKAALSVLLMGSALGQIVTPYIVTVLIDRVYWRDTVIILGALMFLNCFPCGLVIYYSRHYFKKGDAVKVKKSKLVDRECITDAAFMVFLISHVGLNSFITVEQWFVVDLGASKGFSPESSATLLSVNGLVLALSRMFVMIWLGKAPNTKSELHLIYFYLALAAGHVIVLESTLYWTMMLGMTMRGFSAGAINSLIAGLQIDMRGIELYPQTVALYNCLSGAGFVLGGYVGGWSFDITGSYSYVFFLAAGTSAICAISMIIIIIINKFRQNHEIGYEKL